MLLRARIVLPIATPAIENGAVILAGKKIVKVTAWSDLSVQERSRAIDLGDSILLPGLINSHCHLDYTGFAGKIPPRKSFPDWIKALVALKCGWTTHDFAASWKAGAEMLLRNGVTTVADVEAVPAQIPALWKTTPLRVISFREILSIKDPAGIRYEIERACREWARLPANRAGLSPHAPYTTCAVALKLAASKAREHNWLLTTHVAESREEFAMFKERSGALFEWLRSQRDNSDCGLGSPVRLLERSGYLQDNLLAVHVNYLDEGDARLLGRRKVNVVHCPRSHAYFQHEAFPLQEFLAARVNVCLGTDSLASCLRDKQQTQPELNMFSEMQTFANRFPNLPPSRILKMATINGARALGRHSELGQLSPGAVADLIAIPFSGKRADATSAVLNHAAPVLGSIINGRWAVRPRV